MKILGLNDFNQKGFLIESDAGYISPEHPENKKIIRESKKITDYSKPFEFYAVLQKYGVKNKNGRLYGEAVLKREAKNYQKLIERGFALNELNHPESSLIDLERVSHFITEIWWDANVLMGKILLATSPGFHERGIVSTKGDQAANLIRLGAVLGISSRGVGSLVKRGEINEVQDDFELICFDLVSSPSTPGAYVFDNLDERSKFDEEIKKEVPNNSKELDLMSKLSYYLK